MVIEVARAAVEFLIGALLIDDAFFKQIHFLFLQFICNLRVVKMTHARINPFQKWPYF